MESDDEVEKYLNNRSGEDGMENGLVTRLSGAMRCRSTYFANWTFRHSSRFPANFSISYTGPIVE